MYGITSYKLLCIKQISNRETLLIYFKAWASQMALVVKNLPADAGDERGVGSIPGLGRSLAGGHGNPLQYSCLENPTDRGAWRATVQGGPKESDTTKVLSTHCVVSCSTVSNSETPWTQGSNLPSLESPALAGGFFTTGTTWEAHII